MGVQDKVERFEALKRQVLMYLHSSQESAMSTVNDWKLEARQAIQDAFYGMDDEKQFEKELDGVTFSAGGIMGIGNGPIIGPTEWESDEAFHRDIQLAADLMDRCIDKLNQLAQKFGKQ